MYVCLPTSTVLATYDHINSTGSPSPNAVRVRREMNDMALFEFRLLNAEKT
jgi:hypothetical protein